MKNDILLRFFSYLILTLIFSSQNGCLGIFLAGAAAGSLVVYDSRNLQTSRDDKSMRYQIYAKLKEDPSFQTSNINISSFHGLILLTGQTPKASLKVKAEKIAKSILKVQRVYNEISIENPCDLSTRTQDMWITTMVKSKLLTTSSLRSGDIKVVTENGSVYLMGIVTTSQANLATEVARKIEGVKRVVKVFQYLQITDSNDST